MNNNNIEECDRLHTNWIILVFNLRIALDIHKYIYEIRSPTNKSQFFHNRYLFMAIGPFAVKYLLHDNILLTRIPSKIFIFIAHM